MADFESVQTIRGAKLSDLQQHVSDVLSLSLSEEDEYQVGRVSMASYDFVPYAVTGLSAAMQTPASGTRATTHITLPISDDKGGTDVAEHDVTLYGPGDVLGVDPGQVVRRYPAPGSTTAEETMHAHIEFDRPELPWAFSAETPNNRMRSWLALVVFERDEVEWEPSVAGLQPIASVPSEALPPLASAWAWSHAQAVSGSSSLSARLSTAYAPLNISRLLAARVLTQNTNYVACLVPTTDAGARAGLGLTPNTLGPAWGSQGGRVRLPVYDRWEFRTAPDGDFARLARRIVAVPAPWEIGRRLIDMSRPGAPLGDLVPDEPGRLQVIKCALFSPNRPPPGAPSEAARWSAPRTADLKKEVERPAVIEGTAGTNPGDIPDLPIVGPRLYAKGQRGTGTVDTAEWFTDLNLQPTNRVVAGLGTRVVVKDQEPLMQAAWAQVGEIDKANRALALAELARELATSIHSRMAKIDAGRLLQITRPLAPRVRLDGAALTLAGQTSRSATPTAALSGSFRRTVRPTGPIARRLPAVDRSTLLGLVARDGVARDFTRQYSEPDGIGGLSAAAIASLDPQAVAVALRTSPAEALAKVTSASQTLSASLTLATAVTTPSVWKAPDTNFRPGVEVANRIVTRVRERLPEHPDRDVVRSRWLGGLAAGLAVSEVDGTAPMHEVALSLERVVTTLPAHSVREETSPMVVRGMPTRSGGAEMLRGGAARGRASAVTRSPAAAARGIGSIVRPIAAAERGAVALSDRERLDQFRTPQGTQLAMWIERAERITVADVRAQVGALISETGALALAGTPSRSVLTVRRDDVLQRLDPNRTVVDTMRARLNTGSLTFDVFKAGIIRPIMAAPRFDRPMYQALDSYDREWLVPGLGNLPEPDLVTLLSTNDQFTEAFLVGLSDEMGRELLWRSYPTDSRGTYFYRFWDPNSDELREQIHRFSDGRLGSHVTVGPPGESGRAVVVIRGEVVRRYPDLTVMALREQSRDADGRPFLPEAPAGPSEAAPSLFHAMLPPDMLLAGLDITVDALRQPGWWIVLAEHPQAIRFRRDEADLVGHEIRFAVPPGGSDQTGASVAKDRMDHPTRIAFEADDFLPSAV